MIVLHRIRNKPLPGYHSAINILLFFDRGRAKLARLGVAVPIAYELNEPQTRGSRNILGARCLLLPSSLCRIEVVRFF